MRVINRTHYRSDDLRAFLSHVAGVVLDASHRKHVEVTVAYSRKRDACSGRAVIGGTRTVVRINKHEPNRAAFAWIVAHEFRHLRGWTHAEMKATYSADDLTRYAWANDMPLRVAEPKRKARATVDVKLDHARRRLAQALTRQKRATTIAAKWKAKVKYYERRSELRQAAGGSQ